MYMLYVAVVALLFAVVFSTGNKWAQGKLRQPRFCSNRMGTNTGWCADLDFKKAKSDNAPQKRVLVRDTVTMTLNDSLMFNTMFRAEANEELFVPFSSGGLMPFEVQKTFFMQQPETSEAIEEFLKQKDEEAFSADPLLRFARFWNNNLSALYKVFYAFSCVATIVAGFILGVDATRQTTFHATDGTGIKEYPMRGAVPINRAKDLLEHGKVTGVQPVARDTSIVCIKYMSANDVSLCTVSSQEYHVGDDAYVRSLSVLMGEENRRSAQDLAFLVNKTEARALVATGKYYMQ